MGWGEKVLPADGILIEVGGHVELRGTEKAKLWGVGLLRNRLELGDGDAVASDGDGFTGGFDLLQDGRELRLEVIQADFHANRLVWSD